MDHETVFSVVRLLIWGISLVPVLTIPAMLYADGKLQLGALVKMPPSNRQNILSESCIFGA